MPTSESTAGNGGNSSDLSSRALRLWEFLRKRIPTLTLERVFAVAEELNIQPDEKIPAFARRLRQALARHGIRIRHTAALHAAALVLHAKGWFESRQWSLLHTLKVVDLGGGESPIADWHEAGRRLVAACEAWLEKDPTTRAFHLSTTPTALVLSALDVSKKGNDRQFPATPIALIMPLDQDDRWLAGAGSALEYLRRHLEEPEIAVINGLATLQGCDRDVWLAGFPTIDPSDAYNSELVLMREDHPLNSQGYEIARGDELACWAQLDLASDGRAGAIEVDDDGGWVSERGRYTWILVTLKPKKFVPGLVQHHMGPQDAKKLLRRYHLAKRLLGQTLPIQLGGKDLHYLGGPQETYRINRHELLHAMKDAGLTWDQYCAEIGEPGRLLEKELPMGFLMQLVTKLAPKDPNAFFARPTRSELTRADDDSVMRALMSRVCHVRYRVCEGLRDDLRAELREAVIEFRTSILIRLGAYRMEGPELLPDLVYANDGEELMAQLEKWGLLAYVGVMPHFMPFPPEAKATLPDDSWPYAFGHSLYLDIDVREPETVPA
jgi:hypothetical protein